MSRAIVLSSLLGAALQLAACSEPRPATTVKAQPSGDAGYLASPSVTGSQAQAGIVSLRGAAAPNATVRLATPGGQALVAAADRSGRWSARLPASSDARILGLSMVVGGRVVQAQGYVLLTPAGEAVFLRAGSGALRFGPAGRPRITAFDFDREGGAAVSGRAPADAAVSVRVDGAQVADGRADQAGRFNIALARPVRPGRRQLEIDGDGFADAAAVEVNPAPALGDGPFRMTATPFGARADWMTPGGGVQSTLLLD